MFIPPLNDGRDVHDVIRIDSLHSDPAAIPAPTLITGGITAPDGFEAAGVACGLRRSGRPDLAIVRSTSPASVAAVFTTNRAAAAPVLVDRQQLRGGICSAIVVNSAVANSCTGAAGLKDAWDTVRLTAAALGIPESQVMVCSTGLIGPRLAMDKIALGIDRAVYHLHRAGGADAARAIMTTDTMSKEHAVRCRLGAATVTFGAMAKGSGMVHPNMATVLGFVTTDARIAPATLQSALRRANDRTFNRISVDGDMSTNDSVIVLANGRAGGEEIDAGSAAFEQFADALESVLGELAAMVLRDGDGRTRELAIHVVGAADESVAECVGRAVANSTLVRTSLIDADANWGRIVAAIGSAGVEFDPDAVTVFADEHRVITGGIPIDVSPERARTVLGRPSPALTIDLNTGCASATFRTCLPAH